jgi:hypothetical protein
VSTLGKFLPEIKEIFLLKEDEGGRKCIMNGGKEECM